MPLRLYNTLTRQTETLVPGDPARVTFYSCGPTVYDDAHIGNFRSFLAADVLRRWVESPLCELATRSTGGTAVPPVHRGPRRVVHVMNITDVGHMTDDAEGGEAGEDRMAVAGRRLLEAKKQGKVGAEVDPSDPYQIARYFEGRFREDARKLGLKVALEADQDPTLMPRATENVAGMQSMIARLIGSGHAYVTGRPGGRVVYFRVPSFPAYGRLSGNTLDRLREGAGGRISGENQAAKEHPADFLLWKEDASHIMKWDSPWGPGFPGWHIECSVMSAARLLAKEGRPLPPEELSRLLLPDGEPLIDLHSGGEDNIFPHHECEIAQSCCAFNAEPAKGSYARMWFHPRFLLVEGDKMSKSKGNFFTPRDLFAEGYEPAAVRLELIKTHYRSNANFTKQGLKDSSRIIDRWHGFAERAKSSSESGEVNPAVRDSFVGAMHDDLNIAGAIGVINRWVAESKDPTRADAQLMADFDQALGLLERERPTGIAIRIGDVQVVRIGQAVETDSALPMMPKGGESIGVFAPGVPADPKVVELLYQRRAARAAKDFKQSDALRDQIVAMGYAIKDVAGGRVEVTRR